jgi:hypothetical protein
MLTRQTIAGAATTWATWSDMTPVSGMLLEETVMRATSRSAESRQEGYGRDVSSRRRLSPSPLPGLYVPATICCIQQRSRL